MASQGVLEFFRRKKLNDLLLNKLKLKLLSVMPLRIFEEKQIETRIPLRRLPSTCLVEESNVYGRDDDKQVIIKWFLTDDATCNKVQYEEFCFDTDYYENNPNRYPFIIGLSWLVLLKFYFNWKFSIMGSLVVFAMDTGHVVGIDILYRLVMNPKRGCNRTTNLSGTVDSAGGLAFDRDTLERLMETLNISA
ncbi:hypothetical protein FNV43_RR20123 [Rhamnella rubrinervis]|uniref:Uncharacterized protein n=1 Tax=Rhamnella rubrinervis TaxID=2594499 RepID=A0A8K0E0W5_9ROSA|nr:hypothetical protein FNV43_RR20123 [Rhamnella rubrinervis]